MTRKLSFATAGSESGWTRVSSFKPQIGAVVLCLAAAWVLAILLGSNRESLALAGAGTAVSLGLIALNCKVVHQRGNSFRVSTCYYAEIVTADDVCLTVPRPGALWPRYRIHLRRPARFGWTISFVPIDLALVTLSTASNRQKPEVRL